MINMNYGITNSWPLMPPTNDEHAKVNVRPPTKQKENLKLKYYFPLLLLLLTSHLIHFAVTPKQADCLAYLLGDAGMDANQICQGQRHSGQRGRWKNFDHNMVEVEGTRISSTSTDLGKLLLNSQTVTRSTNVGMPLRSDRQLIYMEFAILESATPCKLSIGLGKDLGRTDFMPGMCQDTYGGPHMGRYASQFTSHKSC